MTSPPYGAGSSPTGLTPYDREILNERISERNRVLSQYDALIQTPGGGRSPPLATLNQVQDRLKELNTDINNYRSRDGAAVLARVTKLGTPVSEVNPNNRLPVPNKFTPVKCTACTLTPGGNRIYGESWARRSARVSAQMREDDRVFYTRWSQQQRAANARGKFWTPFGVTKTIRRGVPRS